MVSAIAQRIGEFITYKKVSRREFASRLGYASSEKINRLFRKDGAKPGFDIVEDIANKFVDIDPEWLVTGRGKMLKYVAAGYMDAEGEGDFMADEREVYPHGYIPFIPASASEAYRTGYNHQLFVRQMSHFSFPGLGMGSYRMFEVEGGSMYPVIQDRDKVVAKRCSPDELVEDRVYVLLTSREGILIRRLGTLDVRVGRLGLKGNPYHKEEYPSLDLKIGDILEIWEAAYLLTRHFPDISGIDKKVNDLELGFKQMEERLKQKGI